MIFFLFLSRQMKCQTFLRSSWIKKVFGQNFYYIWFEIEKSESTIVACNISKACSLLNWKKKLFSITLKQHIFYVYAKLTITFDFLNCFDKSNSNLK